MREAVKTLVFKESDLRHQSKHLESKTEEVVKKTEELRVKKEESMATLLAEETEETDIDTIKIKIKMEETDIDTSGACDEDTVVVNNTHLSVAASQAASEEVPTTVRTPLKLEDKKGKLKEEMQAAMALTLNLLIKSHD